MSGGGFEAAATGLAVFLTALATKALDDLLDEPEGWLRASWVMAYIAVALVVAAGLDPGATVSLFLAAYAVGMVPSLGERLPSGLPSWTESLVAMAIAAFAAGPVEAAGSLLVVAGAQAYDDYWDSARDRRAGRASIASAIGRGGALTMALLFWGAGLFVGPVKTAAGVAVTAAVVAGFAGAAGAAGRAGGERGEGPPGAGLRLAATAVAAVALSVGASMVTAAGGYSGPGGWGLLVLAASTVLAVGAGFLWSYRRGLRQGLARGREAARLLAAIEERVDRLDGGE